MAKSTDWLPSSRTVLAMAHEQMTYLTGERRTAWGVPEGRRYFTAKSLLSFSLTSSTCSTWR